MLLGQLWHVQKDTYALIGDHACLQANKPALTKTTVSKTFSTLEDATVAFTCQLWNQVCCSQKFAAAEVFAVQQSCYHVLAVRQALHCLCDCKPACHNMLGDNNIDSSMPQSAKWQVSSLIRALFKSHMSLQVRACIFIATLCFDRATNVLDTMHEDHSLQDDPAVWAETHQARCNI